MNSVPAISTSSKRSLIAFTPPTICRNRGLSLHRGIATRAFERRFTLAEHVRVTGASHENGMLHIDLKREVPEALKPRRIEIAGPNTVETKVIESDPTTEV